MLQDTAGRTEKSNGFGIATLASQHAQDLPKLAQLIYHVRFAARLLLVGRISS